METLARDGKIVIGMVGLPARGKVPPLSFNPTSHLFRPIFPEKLHDISIGSVSNVVFSTLVSKSP